MLVSFNPMVSNNRSRVQKQKFGSFDVPKNLHEARRLYEKAYGGDLKPTEDNLKSLALAEKQARIDAKFALKQLHELWKSQMEELKKKSPELF